MRYTVNPPPFFQDPELQKLANYMQDELSRIAMQNEYSEPLRMNFVKYNSEPDRPRDGDVAYADGTNWNPGHGQGLYRFDGTLWKPLMSDDYWLQHAIDVISANYGDTVSVVDKGKDLVKFGRVEFDNTTNNHTVQIKPDDNVNSTHYNEVYATGNTIDYIVSSNNSDTMASKLEGHTIDGSGNYSFLSQDVTLAGNTPVLLGTPLVRTSRWYNNDSATAQGVITVYDSSVTAMSAGGTISAGTAGVHMVISAGKQNSEKAATTLSSQDYWIVTGVYADVLAQKSEPVYFSFEVREKGKVFRELFQFSASSDAGTFRVGYPYIIVKPNSDVRIRAHTTGAVGVIAGAGIFGALAIIV